MRKKILLVEDERALGLLYEEELGREGYDVTAVTDAEAALAALDKTAFDHSEHRLLVSARTWLTLEDGDVAHSGVPDYRR